MLKTPQGFLYDLCCSVFGGKCFIKDQFFLIQLAGKLLKKGVKGGLIIE